MSDPKLDAFLESMKPKMTYEDSVKAFVLQQKKQWLEAEHRRREGITTKKDSLILKLPKSKPAPEPTEAEKQAKKLKTQVSIRKSKEYLAGKKKITKIVRPKEPPTTLVSKYFASILSDAELLHFKKTYIETERAYVEKKYLATGAPPELAKAKAITYIKQKWDFKYGKYFTPERSLVGEIPTRTSEENWWNKEK